MEITEFCNVLFNGNTTVRIFGTPDHPLFVANDIGSIMEIADIVSSTKNFNDKEKGKYKVPTLGGRQEMTVLTKLGLIRIIFGSHSEMAVKFREWILEVLESIHKTGRYESKEIRQKQEVLDKQH